MKIGQFIRQVVNHNRELYRSLKSAKKIRYQNEIPYPELHAKVHASKQLYFVLSTGRCGTKLLSNIVELNKQASVFHHPSPELLYHSTLAYAQPHDPLVQAYFDGARYELLRNTFLKKEVYVETNNRITFFAHAIKRLYPNAKFIHLVRNPANFIQSGLTRNWYEAPYYYMNEGLIVPVEHSENWQQYVLEEKIACLWNATNQFIEDFKTTLPETDTMTVKSEDLFTNPETANAVLRFMSLEPLPPAKVGKMISKRVNKGVNVDRTSKDISHLKQFMPLFEQYYNAS